MNGLNAIWRKLLKAALVLMIALLLAIMIVQVVARYGFNNSLIWAEELCRYLLVWASMLALLFAYERNEIAAVRLALLAMPRRAGFAIAILGNLLGAALCLGLVYLGFKYAAIAGSQPIPALRFILSDLFGEGRVQAPSMFWVYAILPVGMGMLGVRIIVEGIQLHAAFRGDASLADFYDATGERDT